MHVLFLGSLFHSVFGSVRPFLFRTWSVLAPFSIWLCPGRVLVVSWSRSGSVLEVAWFQGSWSVLDSVLVPFLSFGVVFWFWFCLCLSFGSVLGPFLFHS